MERTITRAERVEKNRQILSALLYGQTLKEVAQRHGMSQTSCMSIAMRVARSLMPDVFRERKNRPMGLTELRNVHYNVLMERMNENSSEIDNTEQAAMEATSKRVHMVTWEYTDKSGVDGDYWGIVGVYSTEAGANRVAALLSTFSSDGRAFDVRSAELDSEIVE